jgi:hypothetical protein
MRTLLPAFGSAINADTSDMKVVAGVFRAAGCVPTDCDPKLEVNEK